MRLDMLISPVGLPTQICSTNLPMRKQLCTVAGALLASLAFCAAVQLFRIHIGRALDFYLMPSRFWELQCGVLLCLADARRQLGSALRLRSCLQLPAALLLLLSLFFTPVGGNFPIPWAVPAVMSALGLITVCAPQINEPPLLLSRFLALEPIVRIGQMSYSIYLWHWPIIVLFRWTAGINTAYAKLAALLLTAILSAWTSRYIETPFRQRPQSRQWHVFAAAVGGMAITCFGLIMLRGPFYGKLHVQAWPCNPAICLMERCIVVGGKQRCWLQRMPEPSNVASTSGVTDSALPLIIDLHGLCSHARFISSYSGFAEIAAAHGAIIVWPQAFYDHDGCARWDVTFSQDDVKFLTAIVHHLNTEHSLHGVYVTGHSYGCSMAHRFVAESSEGLVDAMACMAGYRTYSACHECRRERNNIVIPSCDSEAEAQACNATPPYLYYRKDMALLPRRKAAVPVLDVYGTLDPILMRGRHSFARWSVTNGCVGMPVNLLKNELRGELWVHQNCSGHATVGLLLANGYAHQPYLPRPRAQWPWQDRLLDTTALAWTFMRNAPAVVRRRRRAETD